jgi:transposase
MAKIKSIELTEEERTALERGWKHGPSHAFRQRCQMILLKAQWLTSQEVARQVGCCEVVVNTWLQRYQQHSLDGLKTRQGRGRRPILQTGTDLEAVRRAVQKNRQRVSLARAELEQELGKEFSQLTLRRFLKKTADASSAFDDA